jgi:hypothetical protein
MLQQKKKRDHNLPHSQEKKNSFLHKIQKGTQKH